MMEKFMITLTHSDSDLPVPIANGNAFNITLNGRLTEVSAGPNGFSCTIENLNGEIIGRGFNRIDGKGWWIELNQYLV
jgi:hypothetical protein